jgi:hypothetical protein
MMWRRETLRLALLRLALLRLAMPLHATLARQPRVLLRRSVAMPAAAVLLAGCVELMEPTMPDPRSPAILQANMRIFDAGAFQVDGSLMPGREETGFLRVVQVPFIQAAGFAVEPRTLNQQGVRTYQSGFAVPRGATSGPFDLVVPDVRGTTPLPPVRWWGLQRVGSDTVRVQPGADVVLRMDTVPEASQPENRWRQWFLEIRTGTQVFRVSADAAPPSTLRIPAEWVPGQAGGRSDISLIYYQSAQLRAPDNTYIANILLDTRLNWVVLFAGP